MITHQILPWLKQEDPERPPPQPPAPPTQAALVATVKAAEKTLQEAVDALAKATNGT